MMLTTEQIEAVLAFGPGKEIPTKNGPRILRKAEATPEAWAFYRANKSELAALGISPGKKWRDESQWEFNWWGAIPVEIAKARSENLEQSKAMDADYPVPSPAGLEYLPYQRAGIRFAANKRGVLLADEMGLGKTIQAIGLINLPEAKIHRACLIVPNNLKINWMRELRRWLVKPLSVGVADSKCFPSTDIVILNYDIAHKWADTRLAFDWDLLVCDEAHFLKNPGSRRTQAVLGYKPRKKEIEAACIEAYGKRPADLTPEEIAKATAGIRKSAIPAKRRLFMTGTPIVNKPVELWPIISSLDPDTWANFFSFAKRYCGGSSDRWGFDASGASNLEELQRRLRESIMIRRKKADVLKELPAKRRQIVVIENEGDMGDVLDEEREAIRVFEQDMEDAQVNVELAKASGDDGAYAAAVAGLRRIQGVSFEAISRVRHMTALRKLPKVIENIQTMLEDLDPEEKVLIFCHHIDVLDGLQEAFPGCARVDGGVSTVKRMAEVDRFQNDPKCRVFIGNDAAREGLTLTAASYVCFAELDWVPGNMSQWEDRAHRIGQKDIVFVYHFVLDGSLDCRMVDIIVGKQEIMDKALDRTCPPPEASEPVLPHARRHVSATRAEIEEESAKLTEEQIQIVHSGLKQLAGRCDHAARLDDAGFSKVDVRVGHSLADSLFLTPKQAALGRRLIRKYRRQVPDVADALGVGPTKETDEM